MTRGAWLAGAGAAAAGLGLALGLAPGAGGRGAGEPAGPPVLEVTRGRFVHRITCDGNLAEVESAAISVPPSIQSGFKVAWIAEDGARVRQGDVVIRFDPTEAERKLADGLADRTAVDRREAKAGAEGRARLDNLDRDAEQARLELREARTLDGAGGDAFSRHERIESRIDEGLARARERHALGARRIREGLQRTELELLAIERRKVDLRLDEARTMQQLVELRAPDDGFVLLERNWRGEPVRVGQEVWPGQTLARIPSLGRMQAEVWVLEADAGGLVAGSRAEVRIEAHPDRAFPARVTGVDSLAKPRVRGVPVQYFGAVLELESTVPGLMKPGARVRATVLVEEREDAIAVPRQAVFDRDGARVVWRRSGGGFEPVAVGLGPASLSHVVVESGLEAGDVIALGDPAGGPAGGPAGTGP